MKKKRERERERNIMNKISKCNICGEFFNSKKDMKEHKDNDHRITNSKIV
jgi:hypothetical protein